MPQKPKTAETTEEPIPKSSTKSKSPREWWKRKWLLLGIGLVLVAVICSLVFLLPKDAPGDNQPLEEETSLADQLAQIEFDDSVSQEDQELHYLSVASAYMADGDFDNALAQYLKAEEAGQVNARLYSDVAAIYETKEENTKHEEYLKKYIDFILEETAELKDQLSISGNYIVIAQSYEKLGDNASAKSSYEKALAAVNKVKSDDPEVNSTVQESKTFIEQKLAEL